MRREVEVDTALAGLYMEVEGTNGLLDSNKLTLARLAGVKAEYVTRSRREVRETAEELIEKLRAKLDAGEIRRWDVEAAEEAILKREELLARRAGLLARMEPLNAEYAEKRWSRFFLVQNHGGHIHSSMSCSTCFVTTRFGWLPELSGLTEKDAVDAHGPLLCSVCFPSAPVEWTVGAAKKEDPDQCPGSGTWDHDSSGLCYAQRRARCNHCRQTVSATSTGKLRKHKRKVAA